MDFQNKELAEFLEQSVSWLFDLNPNSVGIVALNDDKDLAWTGFLNCSPEDKARLMHHIQTDITMDVISSNIHHIHDMLMEYEEEDDGEGTEEDGDEP